VCSDAVLEVVVDRADLDRVLHRAERALGELQLLVGADRGWCAERLGGHEFYCPGCATALAADVQLRDDPIIDETKLSYAQA
jgi:hypothetical protein